MDYKEQFEEYLAKVRFYGALAKPMHSALSGSAHRIRPQLTLAWCEACGGKASRALPLALAVELVHTMSLIQDDLPCMDNADERRGRCSLHRSFGEAAALLSSDALLSAAFMEIAHTPVLPPGIRVSATAELASAAMAMAEAQERELRTPPVTVREWMDVHRGKTGALIGTACALGALAAESNEREIVRARSYGSTLGLAYQLVDDIRDNDGIAAYLQANEVKRLAHDLLARCRIDGDSPAHRFLAEFPGMVI